MKKQPFFVPFFFFVLLLSGCGKNSDTQKLNEPIPAPDQVKIQVQEVIPPSEPLKETPKSELTTEDLSQNKNFFRIRKELQEGNKLGFDLYLTTYNQPDCYGSENALIYSEDLLDMLSFNDKARSIMKPNIYTKEYAKNLLDQITKYNNDVLEPPASVFALCHLGEDIDVVAAKYFFDGREENSKFDTIASNQKEHIMFFFSNGKMYPIKNLQMVDNTATGGEVYPCKASLASNHILWSCFVGLDTTSNPSSTQGLYHDTKISLDGRILGTNDRQE